MKREYNKLKKAGFDMGRVELHSTRLEILPPPDEDRADPQTEETRALMRKAMDITGARSAYKTGYGSWMLSMGPSTFDAVMHDQGYLDY